MKIWLDEYYTETKDAPAVKRARKRRTKTPTVTPHAPKSPAAPRMSDDERKLLRSLIGG